MSLNFLSKSPLKRQFKWLRNPQAFKQYLLITIGSFSPSTRNTAKISHGNGKSVHHIFTSMNEPDLLSFCFDKFTFNDCL